MPVAFVCINTAFGSDDWVVDSLKKIGGIKEVYKIYGIYDIIARIEGDSMEEVKEAISSRLRKIEDIKSTITMVVMK